MTGTPCPGCGAPPRITVGTPYVGAVGFLWWKREFEEQLYRCTEGHVYSVRVSGDEVTVEPHDSVDDWLRKRTGDDGPSRPPGL
jgi:hypothetical protein